MPNLARQRKKELKKLIEKNANEIKELDAIIEKSNSELRTNYLKNRKKSILLIHKCLTNELKKINYEY